MSKGYDTLHANDDDLLESGKDQSLREHWRASGNVVGVRASLYCGTVGGRLLMKYAHHEHHSSAESATPGPNRSFGLVMLGAFAILAAFNAWHDGQVWPWATVQS